jgi:SAM-dependent methyltransferase
VNSAPASPHYPFDNAAPQAGDRFANLSALYDEVTCRHLDRFGIRAGWRCLEVGAGGGSIARIMSQRVGAQGYVMATDINTDWMAPTMPANVDMCRHDIGVDPLPEAAFDVVHSRAVLTFVPERRSALRRMFTALKPQGWLLVEELIPPITEALDSADEPDAEVARKGRTAIVETIRRQGGDPVFAREIPRLMAEAGLSDVGAEGYFVPFRTDAVAALSKANIDQLGPSIVDGGLMTSSELAEFRRLLELPDLLYPASMALISVWGRRQLA